MKIINNHIWQWVTLVPIQKKIIHFCLFGRQLKACAIATTINKDYLSIGSSHEKGNLPTKSLHTNDWSYNMLLIVSWIAMDTRTDESSNFIGMHHNITQQRASSYVGLGNINHRMTQSQFELSTTCGCIPMTLITNAHRSIMLWPSNNKGKSDIAWVSKYYSLPTILWCKFWFENCLSFDGYQFNPSNCWCHVTESTVHHLPLT